MSRPAEVRRACAVIEQYLRDYTAGTGPCSLLTNRTQEDFFPALTGYLNLSDEAFDLWKNLPRRS